MTAGQRRVAVITGASSGIGKAAALALAARGWRIIGLGRDATRSAQAEAEIRVAGGPAAEVEMIVGDLALLKDAARMADAIAARTDRVDALINNAGGVARERRITAEGNEANFAGNHLGHFVLTDRLLPLLRTAAADTPPGAVRILSTTSDAHESLPGMNWNDLQLIGNFSGGYAYCNAKLANILFTRGLATRLAADGIVAHAVHPGAVESNFASYADPQMQARIATHRHVTPEEGADTLVWLATEREGGESTGGYWHRRESISSSPAAADPDNADRLWRESEAIAARAGV